MSAVLVPDDRQRELRAAVEQLRADLRVPDGLVMSWKKSAKTHERRRRAAEVLGAVSGIRICYVYAKKSELRRGTYVDDRTVFYNYVAMRTFKSIVWACRHLGASDIVIRWGQVRHHDHVPTAAYIRWQAEADPKIPHRLVSSMRWVPADKYAESQAADLFGGFLKSALWPSGDFGYTEPSYLLSIWPMIRNSESCAIPLGILSMPHNGVLTCEPWFPCSHCKR